MAHKPNKKPGRRKPPTVGQRLKAEAKDATRLGKVVPGREPPRHKPDHRIDKAQRLWKELNYDEAIWHYERALARDPHNPILLVDVSRAYALRYRFADAQKLVDLANALHPGDGHLQQMLGNSYLQIQQYDKSIACFQRSLELWPESPQRAQVLVELAKMYERLHDLASARKCAAEAIEHPTGFLQGTLRTRQH